MPPIRSYSDSILNHESRFTAHFESLGFTYRVAYPHENYPGTPHPAFERAQQLLEDGCPVLKRRPFFHDPLYLDREGVIGRWLLDEAEERGYPSGLILQNMAKTAQPRILNTTASLLEILPEQQVDYDPERPLRILAAVHIFYEDMTDELLDRLEALPGQYDLVATTTDEGKAEFIRGRIAERAAGRLAKHEVRVLPSNRGRDLSAFFVGTRDVLVSGEYDLVVKVHSKKTVQQGAAVGTLFKRQQLDNLLGSPGYTANLIGLFQKEAGLGAVFPPTVHIGFPTLGGAWFTNKAPTKELADRLGIRVPFDEVSPLAPLGAMWVARPEALRLLFTEQYAYEDYAPETDHSDGSLAHVQERIIPYAAAELGYHVRTVATAEYAAISHTFMEYKLDQLSRTVQGYAIDEVRELDRHAHLTRLVDAGLRGTLRAYIGRHHPDFQKRLSPIVRRVRRLLGRGPSPTDG
jgi:rhamnosyltransferase